MRLFKFLFAILMFNRFIIDDDGAGGDIGDIEIDDINPATNGDDTKSTPSTDEILTLQKTVKELQDNLAAKEEEEARKSILTGLQKSYPTFEADKVKEFLIELHKTNPQKAQELNTPLGWELIHLQNFEPKKGNNDYVDFGRNGGIDRSGEVLEKLDNGGRATLQDKKALLGKYFI